MKLTWLLAAALILSSCGKNSLTKVLKNPDPEYKLRMAEKYYVKEKWAQAQILYQDVLPYYKTGREFEDIYYKYAYTAYYQKDYTNAENLFKSFIEIFPNSTKAEEVDFMRAYSFYMQSPKPSLDQTNTIRTIGMMQTFINTHPGSARNKEAAEIIDICRAKLETKDYLSAKLYFDMGQYRAAAVAFASLLSTYPESQRADEYKLMVIRSYYRFAEMSIEERKVERFEQVLTEVMEFNDRFPESKLKKQVDQFYESAQNQIKIFSNNEQIKTSA